MTTLILWILLVGEQPVKEFPSLTACAEEKRSILYTHATPMVLIACVPQEQRR